MSHARIVPVDTVTTDNIFSGMPFVSFAPKVEGAGYDPYVPFGVVDSAELQRTVDKLEIGTSQHGTRRLVKELVQNLEQRLQVQVFNFSALVTRYFIGSDLVTEVSANPAQAVTGDSQWIPSTDPTRNFITLSNKDLAEPLTAIAPDTLTLEFVGTGDGSLGEDSGDFELAYAIDLLGDITLYRETSAAGVVTDRTADLVTTGVATGKINVIVGPGATSGEFEYFTSEAPAIGTTIEVTYTPSFEIGDFVLNTDYIMDPLEGRVRFLTTDELRAGQPVTFGYDYHRKSHSVIRPGTQTSFDGRLRIEHLTSHYGINLTWDVPNVTLHITDDAFAWARDDAALATLSFTFNTNVGTPDTPYGEMLHYDEIQANV